MTVRFGICGLGFAGSVLMAPDLRAHPDVEIVAACDPNEDVRTRFGADYGIPVYPDLTAMIAGTRLDAVYIASPHQYHCPNVVEASRHGIHAIVEKPLTINLADAQTMLEAVEAAGTHLVVGHSRSNDPVVKKMRELVLSGDIGRLAMINCTYYNDFLYRPRRPEELDTSKGGGIIFNQMPHAIDSIKAISGQRIVAVRAAAGQLDAKRPTEGHCAALLTLSDGAVATVIYSGYDHFDSDELQFWISETGVSKKPAHGSARRVLRELSGMTERDLRVQRYGYGGPISQGMAAADANRKQSHFGVMLVTCEGADLRPSADGVLIYGHEGMREVPVDTGPDPYRVSTNTIDELLDAMNGKAPVLRNASWGMDTVRVCLSILESSRTGAQIDLTT